MVRAILEGRKTVTRRVVKSKHLPFLESIVSSFLGGKWNQRPMPYGRPGDRLWVRETFCYAWDNERECWPEPERYLYRADGVEVVNVDDGERSPWKPGIHMPRRASRITLEVTGVHVERLQDISEEHALAEGIRELPLQERESGHGGAPIHSATQACTAGHRAPHFRACGSR